MHVTTRDMVAKAPVSETALAKFDDACARYGGLALVDMSQATKAIQLSQAIQAIEDALTPEIMAQIMRLQGRMVGYKTDKDKNRDGSPGPGYPVATVKEVMVEAILFGARPTGNEVNIIAGGCYLTKEHFQRKVRELPGLTDLELTFGVPKLVAQDERGNCEAHVNCRARWKLNGLEQSIGYDDKDPCVIVCRVYNGQGGGYDQAIGKAEKKLRVRIWQRATGSTISIPEADVAEIEAEAKVIASESAAPASSSKAEAVHDRLRSRNNGRAAPPANTEDEVAQANARREEQRQQLAQAMEQAAGEPVEDEPPATDPLIDACQSYRELIGYEKRAPAMMRRSLELCGRKSLADLDHTDPEACGEVVGEFVRLKNLAKGK